MDIDRFMSATAAERERMLKKPSAERLAAAAREMRNAEREFDSVASSCSLRGVVRDRVVEKARQRRVNARVDLDDLIAAFYRKD